MWIKPAVKNACHRIILIIQLVLLLRQLGRWAIRQGFPSFNRSPIQLCPQAQEVLPLENLDIWNELGQTFRSHEFRQRAIDYLGGAVRVPYATLPLLYHLVLKLNAYYLRTESYDKMGVDPRWNVFDPFHEYLLKAFPLV